MGAKVHAKLKSMLDSSSCLVSNFTSDTLRDGTLQNQEIGYFAKLGRTIIPIKEESFQIRGFLEGTEYITLRPHDLDYNSYELIGRIRYVLSLGRCHVECMQCGGVFDPNISTHNEINTAIDRGYVFDYDCVRCHTRIEEEPKPLASVKLTVPGYTPKEGHHFTNGLF